jgi:hypothetical protein
MIIQSLHIENMLHFDELSLEDIPSHGQINFSHEEPKYTADIIQVIYFALYGRTLNNQPLETLLCDEAEYFATSIQIAHQGDEYTLMRTFDIYGTLAVQMTDLQEDMLFTQDEIDNIFTNAGIDKPTDFLQKHVLQYASDENVDLLNLLDLHEYQQAYIQLNTTSPADSVTQETTQLGNKLDALALEETWLPELVDARETLFDQQTIQQKQTDQLKNIRQHYPEQYNKFHRRNQRYQIFNKFANLLFPLTSVIWLIWALFIFTPDLLKTWLPSNTYDLMAHWVPSMLFSVGSVVIAFYGFSLLYSWWLDVKGLTPLHDELANTSEQLAAAYTTATLEPDLSANIQRVLPTTTSSDFKLTKETFALLIKQLVDYGVEPDQLKRIVVTLQNKIKSRKLTSTQYLNVINDNIETEMEKSGQAANIRQQLMQAQNNHRHEAEQESIRQLSQNMLLNAAKESLQTNLININPTLAAISDGQFQISGLTKDFEIIVDVNGIEKTLAELNPEAINQIRFAPQIKKSLDALQNNVQHSTFLILDAPDAIAEKLTFDQVSSNHQLWCLNASSH